MSNETKFTAGPWVAGDISDYDGTTTITGGITGRKICQIGYSKPEDDANIDLIAAAPEMYAMLEAIEAGNGQPNCDDILALLAKARGEK